MKAYVIQSKVLYWVMTAGSPVFFVVVGGSWMWIALTQPQQNAPVWFGVVWLALCVYGCIRMVAMPHRIEVTDTGIIHFIGAFKTTVVAPLDVTSVRANGAFVAVKHTGGTVLALHQFTGFHEFVTELKQRNETVRLNGV